MFSIGQLSRISGLTVKTIRLYHEKGLLVPKWIDESTGYRYYDAHSVEQARAISHLRALEFPLAEIREILDRFTEDEDVLAFLQNQRRIIQSRIDRLGSIARSLDEIILTERENQEMTTNSSFEVGEKHLEEVEVAGLRWKGRYADTGKAFSQLGRLAGRHICGKPLNLYYDSEYKEDDADIESCVPVRHIRSSGALSVRRLPPGKCVYVVHKGPYEQIGRAYARVMEYIQKKNYTALSPSREVYLKGPGMIFRGNPKNYLTEIQVPIETPEEAGHESQKS